ncbi:hypothetical protein [Sphingomonas sp. NFX23]|uniref:hypothetical protein n=1 Tax=Sphingomonas sp. NFX23 TaxID=2819532 RepID=UPI003CF22D83
MPDMASRAPTAFRKSATGAWETTDGKYEVRREGLRVGERFTLYVNGRREVALFACPERYEGVDGPEYTWILGATSAVGKTVIGFETYETLFNAFFKTYQQTTGLKSGSPSIAFDPDVELAMWDRWGP